MVVIHVKKSETDGFLYECTTQDSNDKVVRELCQISNTREKIGRLASACEELATYGPAKPEAERGIDEIQEKDGKKIVKGPYYVPDPLGNRTGNAPAPQLQEVIRKTCADALASCASSLAPRGTALTLAGLQEKVALIRGAVTMAWPGGLPEYDMVRMLIDDGTAGAPSGAGGPAGAEDAALQDAMGHDYLDPSSSSLWWAGKEFFRDQCVGDRVGKNEKTKVVARLQKKGSGAPVREPAVSEAERAAMMAWYHKKQEEAKALAENEEDAYLNAKWADGKALKRELLGTTQLGWRGPGAGGGGGGGR